MGFSFELFGIFLGDINFGFGFPLFWGGMVHLIFCFIVVRLISTLAISYYSPAPSTFFLFFLTRYAFLYSLQGVCQGFSLFGVGVVVGMVR